MQDASRAVNRFLEAPVSGWARNNDAVNVSNSTDRPTIIHLRMNGRSQDITLFDIGLTPAATQRDVLAALQRHLDLPHTSMAHLMLDRAPNGNWIFRPAAVFG